MRSVGPFLITLVFLLLVPYTKCLVFTPSQNISWGWNNSPPYPRNQIIADHTGLIFNTKGGFFKVSFDYSSYFYNISLTNCITTSVQYETDTMYSIVVQPTPSPPVIRVVRYLSTDASQVWNTTLNITVLINAAAVPSTQNAYAHAIDKNSNLLFIQSVNETLSYVFRLLANGTYDTGRITTHGLSPGAMAVANDSTPWLTGYSTDAASGVPTYIPFLAKLDSNTLNFVSFQGIPVGSSSGYAEETYAILWTSTAIYIGGRIQSAITGWSPMPPNGNADAYVAKYNSSGYFEKAITFSSYQDDRIFGIYSDSYGNLLTCGTTRGNLTGTNVFTNYSVFFARILPGWSVDVNETDYSLSTGSIGSGPTLGCYYDPYAGVMHNSMTTQPTVSRGKSYVYANFSPLPSVSTSPSRTPSTTPSRTPTPSVTPSVSITPSVTPTPSPSVTPTSSVTPSGTPTPSVTPTPSPSVTPTSSVTPTVTPTSSVTPSVTPSTSASATASASFSPSNSPSVTPSRSSSPSMTPSVSPTSSVTPSASATPSVTPSSSTTPSISATPSITPTVTPSNSVSSTPLPDLKSKVNTAAIAGGIVGSAVFSIAAMALVLFVFQRRKKRNQDKDEEDNSVPLQPTDNSNGLKRDSSINLSVDQHFEIPYKQITMDKEIGRGAFGVVYKAKWRNCDCVVKQLNMTDPASKEEFLKEANNVRKLKLHPNVCGVFGVCTDPLHPTSIVMEFVEGGSLKELVYDDSAKLDALTVVRFAKDVASGMGHIHHEGLLHCDLACRNLLYTSRNGRYVIKVTDLGLARISETGHYDAKADAKFPIRWSAPEVLSKQKLSKASDVWSFGVVIYEMMQGRLPYYSLKNADVPAYVCEGGQLEPPARIDCPQLWNVAVQCMRMEPSSRPSFEALYHELERLEAEMTGTDAQDSKAKNSVEDRNDNYNNPTPESTTQYGYANAEATSNTNYSSPNIYGNDPQSS